MYPIKINDKSEEGFRGQRELRQENPLSPYLFVMYMEVLTQMFYRATAAGNIGYHPKCGKLEMSHLNLANDLMVFVEASQDSLQDIQGVLDNFQHMSGLGVSYNKSEIFCSCASEDEKQELAKVLRLKGGCLLVRYLGVPLISKKPTLEDCKPLVERIIERIRA